MLLKKAAPSASPSVMERVIEISVRAGDAIEISKGSAMNRGRNFARIKPTCEVASIVIDRLSATRDESLYG
jgi:hypothetical protein